MIFSRKISLVISLTFSRRFLFSSFTTTDRKGVETKQDKVKLFFFVSLLFALSPSLSLSLSLSRTHIHTHPFSHSRLFYYLLYSRSRTHHLNQPPFWRFFFKKFFFRRIFFLDYLLLVNYTVLHVIKGVIWNFLILEYKIYPIGDYTKVWNNRKWEY